MAEVELRPARATEFDAIVALLGAAELPVLYQQPPGGPRRRPPFRSRSYVRIPGCISTP